LYRGAVHPDREGARLVAIGSEEERALLDALLSWSDYQISPSRRDSLFTLTNDSTQAAEFRESLLLDLDDAQRRALALTGVLRELEEQRTRRLRK